MPAQPEKQRGDTLTAEEWNALVKESARKPFVPNIERLFVYNNTGADLDQCAVLGLDGPHTGYGPAESLPRFREPDEIVMDGATPDPDEHAGRFAVLLEPTADGRPGKARASGVVRVRVYVNATDDKFCDVIEKETVDTEDCYLGTGGSGAQILWLDPTATVDTIGWAIVRLGSASDDKPFELKDGLNPGETQDAYPLLPDGTADTSATPFPVTDAFGVYRGRGHNASYRGSQGRVRADGEISFLEPNALIVSGRCTTNVTTGNATFALDNVHIMAPTGALIVDQTPPLGSGETLTVLNFPLQSHTLGDIVDCFWDETSGWVQVPMTAGPASLVQQAILTADYVPGDSTLTGYFADDAYKTPVTFYPYVYGPGVGRGGGGSAVVDGSHFYAFYAYNPNLSAYCWWVLSGDFPTVMEAKCYDTSIAPDASGYVELWWRDPNGSGLIDSTRRVTALNCTGQQISVNDKLVVKWSPAEGLWTIIVKQPKPKLFYYYQPGGGGDLPSWSYCPVMGSHTIVTGEGYNDRIGEVIPAVSYPWAAATYRPTAIYNSDQPVVNGTIGIRQDGPIVRVAKATGGVTAGDLWGPTDTAFTCSPGATGTSGVTVMRADCGLRVIGLADGGDFTLLANVTEKGRSKRCSCKLVGILLPGDSTRTVDHIVPLDGGWGPTVMATGTYSTVAVTQTLGLYGPSGAVAIIVWNDQAAQWEFQTVASQAILTGTLSGSLAQGGSASASIEGIGTVTVYDALMKSGATAIASGKKVLVFWDAIQSKWLVSEAECPD